MNEKFNFPYFVCKQINTVLQNPVLKRHQLLCLIKFANREKRTNKKVILSHLR